MAARILVVDDEPQLERLINQRFRRQIQNNEYEFVFARNGVEALDRLQKETDIKIVLSDINMPRMDGLTLLAKLSEIDLLIKTVMVSAYGDMKNIRTAMNRGAYDFVTKPIDFEDLQATIAKTLKEIETLTLAALAREELRTIHDELNVAREIQQSILPRNFSVFPKNSKFEIYAEMIAAEDIGGDFYDFFQIDDTHLGLVIGDVSGKGMPAALFMAISRTLLKAIALKGETPNVCLDQVNHLLSQDNPKSMFVTLFYGVLDVVSGELTFSNGGHNPPCIISANGEGRFLADNGYSALGVVEDLHYQSSSTILEPGCSLILYTDGITEAMDKSVNEFSRDRLVEYLRCCPSSPPRKIIEGIVQEVRSFAVGTHQSDDITTMVVKRNI